MSRLRIVDKAAVTKRTISAYNSCLLCIGKQTIKRSKADLCTKTLESCTAAHKPQTLK